jgi:hypothetical protein
MLGISGHSRGVAVTPLRINLILNLMKHILQRAYRKRLGINSGLFKDFTCSSSTKILIEEINATGNGLPEINSIGSLD